MDEFQLQRAKEPEPPADENELLTTTDVGKILQVSGNSVRRWCESGEIEGVKTPGGHWRISRLALRNFAMATYGSGNADPAIKDFI